TDGTLSADENLWLDLIDTAVQITRRLSSKLQSPSDGTLSTANGNADTHPSSQLDTNKLLTMLRSLVQTAFTALLNSTSTVSPASTLATSAPSSTSKPPTEATAAIARQNTVAAATGIGTNLAFLRILRAFLTRAAAASPSLADLRAVLASGFAAYAYEESILRLSNRLLDPSLFVSVSQAVELQIGRAHV